MFCFMSRVPQVSCKQKVGVQELYPHLQIRGAAPRNYSSSRHADISRHGQHCVSRTIKHCKFPFCIVLKYFPKILAQMCSLSLLHIITACTVRAKSSPLDVLPCSLLKTCVNVFCNSHSQACKLVAEEWHISVMLPSSASSATAEISRTGHIITRKL